MNPNLLTGTRDFYGFQNMGGWTYKSNHDGCQVYGRYELWHGAYKAVHIKANKWYTFSTLVLATKNTSFQLYLTLAGSTDYKYLTNVGEIFVGDVESWKRYSISFKSSVDLTIYPRVEINKETANRYIQICQYKLEEGQKATPWCPNVND